MRCKLAHVSIWLTLWLWGSQQFSYAQQTAPCPTSHPQDEEPAGPEISIIDVTFSGSLRMPISDQNEMAASIKEKTHGTSLDLVKDEALERARAGWQDLGYFKAEVTGEAKTVTSSRLNQRIALSIHVDEGVRYTLSKISFKNNKAITDVGFLRSLFPTKDGEIFSREKIAIGLENLRKAYGELGYVNFTSVPDTEFDDLTKRVALTMDFDEGKQFRVGRITVLGLEDSAQEKLLKSLSIKPGQIFTSKLWESLLRTPTCDCPDREQMRYDSGSGTVSLTLDFRPCSTT
jgi:outer membrane protein assembly factor BamA